MASGMKKYILMHKNIPVVDMELDEASCGIFAVGHIHNEAHLPLGISVKKGVVDRLALNEWWKGRAIPASRAGIKSALLELNLTTTQRLLEKCLGLSLSDQYWICPAGSGVQWSQVNFFNDCKGDVTEDVAYSGIK